MTDSVAIRDGDVAAGALAEIAAMREPLNVSAEVQVSGLTNSA